MPPSDGLPEQGESAASSIGRWVPSATRKSSAATRGPRYSANRSKKRAHRHRARAVRDDHQHALPIHLHTRQTFGSDPADLGVRQEAGIYTGRDDGTSQGGWHRRADKPV